MTNAEATDEARLTDHLRQFMFNILPTGRDEACDLRRELFWELQETFNTNRGVVETKIGGNSPVDRPYNPTLADSLSRPRLKTGYREREQ